VKKIVALMLVLCMMLAAVPVFAESTGGSGLGDLLSGLMGGSESGEGKEGGLGDLLSGLMSGSESGEGKEGGLGDLLSGLMGGEGKEGGLGSKLSGLLEELKKEGKEKISQLGSKLKGKVMEILMKELAKPDSKLAGLLGKFAAGKDKSSDDSAGLESLLGALFGSGSTPAEGAETAEDSETLEETLERLNKEAEAETGDSVPNKKNAQSVEEFYGQWKESKFILFGEAYDMSEYDEGVFIGENTFYVTQEGKKSPDYLYPETAELTLSNGILKVNSDGHWSNFVLTEDGEIAEPSGSLLIYYVRAE